MALIPISYYPTLSNDNFQAQNLTEQKAELSDQVSAVESSSLSKREKSHAVAELNGKISQTEDQIRKKQASYTLDKETRRETQMRRQLKAQDSKVSEARKELLSKEADNIAGGMRDKKELDLYA